MRITTNCQEAPKAKRHCVVGVDANAVVGMCNTYDSSTMIGRYGVGVRTERGDEFSMFAHTNALTVTNTMFQKREHHLWTHLSWSTGELRQIDHKLVSSGWRTKLRNIILLDVFDGSDHRPSMLILDIS